MKIKELLDKTVGNEFNYLVRVCDNYYGVCEELRIDEARKKYGEKEIDFIFAGSFRAQPIINIAIKKGIVQL